MNSEMIIALDEALEEVIKDCDLNHNSQVLESFLNGCDALRGLMGEGLETEYLPQVIEEITSDRRSVRATTQLELLVNKLSG